MVVENTSKCYTFGEITYQVYPNGDIKNIRRAYERGGYVERSIGEKIQEPD